MAFDMENFEFENYGNIKLMFDTMPYTCHLWNKEYQILDCNDASMTMFKVDNKEIFKERFHEFSPECQPDGSLSADNVQMYLDKAFSEGKTVFDWLHIAADGTHIPCYVTAIRVDGKDQQLVVTHVIDMTEQYAMNLQLTHAMEAAQQANHAKSMFLSNMSHEIRTPMNAIIGLSELLTHEHLNERQERLVHDIVVSAKSLLDIINDILDFSKIESGKLELNQVDYDFKALVDNIESLFIYIARKKNLDFIMELDENLPDVFYGDDVRLRQVLINICGNAVKFTETGHVLLNISAEDNNLIFIIKDTGIGIREEDLLSLFNAFEQVDRLKNRNVIGTGLGLTLSKSFVEMMGGEIKIESAYGTGSTFTIIVPLVAGTAENIHKNESKKVELPFSAPEAKILITDDNEFNLKVAAGLLNLMDIDAEAVDSGDKAIELIKKHDFDIIFMDHMMPEKDGIETTREIRNLGGKYKYVPIVALTANAIGNVHKMFIDNGFTDFISKPIDVNQLNKVVRKYLPPELIKAEVEYEWHQEHIKRQDELFQKAAITFLDDNKNTYEKITSALKSGDMKTAHRIAHTLKSSAGFIGKKALQDAAFSLEKSLQNTPYLYSTQQLDIIEKELDKALHDLELLREHVKTEKTDSVQISAEELAALLAQLKPLLKKGDFSATSYVEALKGAGKKTLAARIENYDFTGALELI